MRSLPSSTSTLDSLKQHLAYLEAEFAACRAAPLSRSNAMLVALLVDAYADRLFEAGPEDDILVFRKGLGATSPALQLIFALCALREDGPRLVTEAVEVLIVDYPKLKVEDFMVSLYNDHTVQRVRIALPDGGRRDVHEVLAEAIAALKT